MDYKIEFIPVRDLIPYERNAKKHPREQVERIVASIKKFGFRQNLVIDRNNVVVIGHGRLLAAKELGLDEVPCVRVENLTDAEVKALRLADNKVAESDWDTDTLQLELDDMIDIDMEEFGFGLDFDDDEEEEKIDAIDLEEKKPNREPKGVNGVKCPKCGFVFEV